MPRPMNASTSCAKATRNAPTSSRSAQRGAQNAGCSDGQSTPLSQPSASHSIATRPSAPTPRTYTNGRSGHNFQHVPLGVAVDALQPVARLAQPGCRLVLRRVGDDDEPQPFAAHQLADARLVL